MKPLEFRFLNQEDVKRCGGDDIELFINTMEDVMSLHDNNEYVLPNKTILRWGGLDSETSKGRINSMPAYIGGKYDSCGIKWISSAPMNPIEKNLPRASGVIILNDSDTLLPYAIMDGTLISAMRTGAISGVVAKYLAKENSKVLGLVGAGVQNRTQLIALRAALNDLEVIKIYDIDLKRAESFAKDLEQQIGMEIKVVDSAEQAVRNSDIFVTATVTEKPIIKKEWIEDGALYIHVGSHECEFDVITCSNKIVVDDWEELKHRGVETISIMYKNGLIKDENIYAHLGEIINGKKKGRENNREKIYFNSVGMGIEDVAIAKLIYQRATEGDIGQKLFMWQEPTFV